MVVCKVRGLPRAKGGNGAELSLKCVPPGSGGVTEKPRGDKPFVQLGDPTPAATTSVEREVTPRPAGLEANSGAAEDEGAMVALATRIRRS